MNTVVKLSHLPKQNPFGVEMHCIANGMDYNYKLKYVKKLQKQIEPWDYRVDVFVELLGGPDSFIIVDVFCGIELDCVYIEIDHYVNPHDSNTKYKVRMRSLSGPAPSEELCSEIFIKMSNVDNLGFIIRDRGPLSYESYWNKLPEIEGRVIEYRNVLYDTFNKRNTFISKIKELVDKNDLVFEHNDDMTTGTVCGDKSKLLFKMEGTEIITTHEYPKNHDVFNLFKRTNSLT